VPIGPRTQRFVAAAAPAYLAARGEPKHPRELVDHACIGHRFESGVLNPWEFTRAGKIVRIAPNGPLVTSSVELSRSAALAGLGLTYTFEEFVRADLQSGALVPVLKPWWQSFPGPSLYYPSRAHMPGPLRAFVDFVRNENAA
jgi:DNA-binding transcriptional LysR family regulator